MSGLWVTLAILGGVAVLCFVEIVLLVRYPEAADRAVEGFFGWFERHFSRK